jgi:hypothetical protein
MPVLKAQMTLASEGYDQATERQLIFEADFSAVRRGSIREIRTELANRTIPWFQLQIRRKYGLKIPRRKIRVGFQREEPAPKTQRDIQINLRAIEFRGRIHHAHKEPPVHLRFRPKTRRKHVTKRRQRKRGSR